MTMTKTSPAAQGTVPVGYMRAGDNDGKSFWCSRQKSAYYTEPVFLAAFSASPSPEALPASGVESDAIKFINNLVHMQTGQGWTRAVVREAAAAFLTRHGIPITGHTDTTASIAALAASQTAIAGVVRAAAERVDAGWQTIKDQCHEGSDSGFTEQAAGELSEAIETLINMIGRGKTGWDLVPIVDDAWQELCERDDRTSPAEYPGMCLITHNELAEFMSRAALTSAQAPEDRT